MTQFDKIYTAFEMHACIFLKKDKYMCILIGFKPF